MFFSRPPTVLSILICLFGLAFTLPASAQVSFLPGELIGYTGSNPTSLQFGPDGRLYVSTQDGAIEALTVSRFGQGAYEVVDTETITEVKHIPNHNDDGSPHAVEKRQVTGILVTGSPSQPIIYVTSSDYRMGGGASATDTNLDTNSGVLSRLKLSAPGGSWTKVDLVRGLPRSKENHASNGLQLDAESNTLYIAQGGNTNAGSPSNNFTYLNETALAAAILSVDLDSIEAMPIQGSTTANPWVYDLPTLNDPDRITLADGTNPGDPFGGNNGLNQAVIVEGGPVQVYAPGFRNAYDLVITKSGRMYAVDNGGNQGWGGTPHWLDPADPSTVTNYYDPEEPGSTFDDVNGDRVTNVDYLHHITGPGYYAGHPNPIRANPEGAGWYTFDTSTGEGVWRTSTDSGQAFPLPSDWPPVPASLANPIEGEFQSANNPKGLWGWNASTNGIAEYNASNFDGAMYGNLLTTVFNHGTLERVVLSEDGTSVLEVKTVASNFGTMPLDVTAQGDDDFFPGTIWVAVYGSNQIVAFEPSDYDGATGVPCTGADDPLLDEDGDGYTNADEIANGTDPCNPADTPADFSGNFVSDLLDPDDDGDGILDINDPFQRDFYNGALDHLPIVYDMFNGEPGFGYAGVGFTGWMIDYETDYLEMYDDDQLVVGGAAGLFTISDIGHGDARLDQNDQMNAFQFGLNVDASDGAFFIVSRIIATGLFKPNPQGYQSAGIYIGNGDQDHYLRISVAANHGEGGIEVYYENDGVEVFQEMLTVPEVLTASEHIDLFLSIDPATGSVVPSYSIDGQPAEPLSTVFVDDPIFSLLRYGPDSNWSNALAIGIIATSNPRELETPLEETQFTASWEFIYAIQHDDPLEHYWETLETINGCEARHENGLAAIGGDILLMGGRGIKPVDHLRVDNHTWSKGAQPPIQLHHFQPVPYEGLVYVLGAFTGHFPTETPVENIYIYDSVASKWSLGPEIPEERRRGSAGATVYNGKIYMAAGNTHGHGQGIDTTVSWFDVYDPLTNIWTALPDAPRARDHTQLIEAAGLLYLVGGRVGGDPDDFFAATVPEVDVYDPIANSWSSLPAENNLPTPRGGIAAARQGPWVVVAGGESGQPEAHAEVEGFHVHDQVWEDFPSLVQARHGTGMVNVGNHLYIVAGSGSKGGSPELDSVEIFSDGSPSVDTMKAITPGTLEFEPESLTFDTTYSGSNTSQTVYIGNAGGNQGIVINSFSFSGSEDFSISYPVNLPFILAPDREFPIEVTFTPTGMGEKEASLSATTSNGTSVPLQVVGTAGGTPATDTFVRINSGGPQYMDSLGQIWSADAYFSGGNAHSAGNIDIANTMDPVLYRTERWGGETTSYHIPVNPGNYDVNLKFAEIYYGVTTGIGNDHTGKRVFSVFIEGTEYLPNFDIWATAGPATATIQSFKNIEVLDGAMDITVTISKDSAKFSAIEIVPAGSGESPSGSLASSPAALQFNTVETGMEKALDIQLNNTGEGALEIDSITLEGSDAAAFAFGDLATTTLDPGETVDLTVTFSPVNSGEKNAVMKIAHNGETGLLEVLLEGTGKDAPKPISDPIRINAGGPQYTDAQGKTWMADTYFVGGSAHNAGAINIADTADPSLYRTERWGKGTFSYQIPVEPGEYDVQLHFAEIYYGVAVGVGQNQTGKRVFSVAIEGSEVLSNYDIWSDVGPATAVIHTFEAISVEDGTMSVTVNVSKDNAQFAGIAIVPSGSESVSGTLVSNPESLDFGIVDPGDSKELKVLLQNTSDSTIDISNGVLEGTNPMSFDVASLTVTELAAGETTELSVWFMPEQAGVKSAQLRFDHSGPEAPLTIALNGAGRSEVVQDPIRINVGGPQYTDSEGKTWMADSFFVGGSAHNAGPITIAASADPSLYRTERWGNNTFSYQIPVAPGEYDVKLHLAEIYYGVTLGEGQNQAGKRVFSVSIEGSNVLSNYDIWSDVGPATAVTQSFEAIAVQNGILSITVNVTKDNAKFSAIEVVPTASTPAPGTLVSNPESLDYGIVDPGDSKELKILLKNTSDATIDISNGVIESTDSMAFEVTPLTVTELASGESTELSVWFIPEQSGAKSAQLRFDHSGPESPLTIPLSGAGRSQTVQDPIRINAGGPQYTDAGGRVWMADSYFVGGSAYSSGSIDIAETMDPVLYRTERWGNNTFSYQIPVEPGEYDVQLHFAEIYYGVAVGVDQDQTGKRVFSIALEGSGVLSNYDIWSDVGPATAVTKTFESIAVLDGVLSITVNIGKDSAKFSAIEITPVAD
ncbi:MAG: choice-of-anchor D domain-containing protein [Opitutales bacterium]|nr:choice-of-anchor D domain-containing protein [Opitutales bacterium]